VVSPFQFHPENTTPMGQWIWVFASNEAGKLAKGAAKVARLHFRASIEVSSGPTGSAYAVLLLDQRRNPLSLDRIERAVTEFLAYAREHPLQNFYVTRLACASGQLTDRTVANMFRGVSANCSLPLAWMPFITAQAISLPAVAHQEGHLPKEIS
jgi:hypothetical protein